MIILNLIITILYLLIIGSFVYGFNKVKTFYLKDIAAKTKFSVIIPFRNEADNLNLLLQSIFELKYTKGSYEIILVDDDSDDDSVKIIEKFIQSNQSKKSIDITVTKNDRYSKSPKKDAITTAVKLSKNDWIITTDADCILPKYWLDSYDEFIQSTNCKCIVAPVKVIEENSFVNNFQMLDFLSLQGATIGGFGIEKPFLCNGANFGYSKDLFHELNGFEGNNDVASGDDIFLLEKALKQYPKQTKYLKSEQSIVATKAQSSWSNLINQRIRWVSKSKASKNWFSKLTGGIVLLFNFLLVLNLFLVLSNNFSLKSFLYILIIKFNIDFFLIYKSASFFDQKEVLKSFIFSFFIYPFFSVYVAIASLFLNFKWKNRTFNK